MLAYSHSYDPKIMLLSGQGEPLKDPGSQRLVGKLDYLTVTPPDITFIVMWLANF